MINSTKKISALLATSLAAAAMGGCGSETNLNKMWGTDGDAADSIYIEAKASYDKGDFRHAEDLLEKLVGRNKDNERAVVLLGYTYMSMGGIDPFTLARKLIAITASSTTDATAAAKTAADNAALLGSAAADLEQARHAFMADTGDDVGFAAADGSGSDTTTASTNASSTLTKLSSIVNLSADDFTKLGSPFKGDSDLFGADESSATHLIVPNLVTDDLRNSVDVLLYMNKAMKVICRFVDTGAKVDGDDVANASSCDQTAEARPDAAKAHFLWAFTHLAEAMVFQSVLLYTSSTSGTSNFETASQEISKFTTPTSGDLAPFLAEVTDLKSAVDQVFDVSTPNSMISTTLRDILSVNAAFTALSGLPASMTKPITDALAKINTVAAQVGGDSGATGQTKALKGQMLEKFSSTIGTKISSVTDKQIAAAGLPAGTPLASKADFDKIKTSGTLTATQQTKVDELSKKLYGDPATPTDTGLCGAYTTLSDGEDPTKAEASKPAPCKT